MMRYALTFGVFCFSLTTLAAPAHAADPKGYWLTENKRSVIELYDCQNSAGTLCGSIHWIIEGGMQFDEKNPDEAQRGRPLCGMGILTGLKQDANNPDEWQGGKVYKADDGDVYDAKLTIKDDNNLTMRGFMGVSLFGKSQDWTRVSVADYPRCTPAKK